MVGIIIHGGCHDLEPTERERRLSDEGVRKYGDIGYQMLLKGASAIDVAENVMSLMENDPIFDAGTGSFKNLNGVVEMDAIIMNYLEECGAVQCIQNVKNPIQVARAVLEKTPHSILSGLGAEQFARLQGFSFFDPSVTEQELAIEEVGNRKRMLRDIQYYIDEVRKTDHVFSTVGIVVLDGDNHLVAATSTGGIRMKMPGRVGDSAIPGAGTYCNEFIGLSATGEGEKIIRLCLTYQAAQKYMMTKKLTDSLKNSIETASRIDCICGVIAMTKDGDFSYAHNGAYMPVYHKIKN